MEEKDDGPDDSGGDAGITIGKVTWSGVLPGITFGRVVNAFQSIRSVLADSNCWDFFAKSSIGSLKSSVPAELIDFIAGHASQTGVGSPSTPGTQAQNAQDPVSGYRIFLNSSGSFFSAVGPRAEGNDDVRGLVPGSLQMQVFILLHELAHLLDAPNWIQADDLTLDRMKKNNNLLMEKCGNAIKALH